MMLPTPQELPDSLAFLQGVELAELHVHVGSAVAPYRLWEMAHDQGIRLPTKNFWQFTELVTIRETKTYEEYLQMYDMLEMIQSSPEAMHEAMQTAISGAYRSNNITTLELRFNPILRNRQGERDLDHLIIFALQGMERGMLQYPVKVGLILSLDRRFNQEENGAIVKKAIKYKHRGVVGIDLAGPIARNSHSREFKPQQIAGMVAEAKAAGLGVTVHTGEATGPQEMWEVIEQLKPDRMGHGIACVGDPKLMQHLAKNQIVLETCPTSNIQTRSVSGYDQLKQIYHTLKKNGVPFTINTDGPEMQQVSLKEEYRRLLEEGILTAKDILECNKLAKKVSFLHL